MARLENGRRSRGARRLGLEGVAALSGEARSASVARAVGATRFER
ncbi:hypothetical protein [Conexibacter arvalis]|uniref:Uncharacterized protein n=1 Tax=Conexibacter arvalis TaxID=912552 RepID=A0A840ICC3_9ACTN|nr:hypothetical protein [Conexibacter arvalis]MBB4661863.1 hypothetical protein [Conexibacter arvalis]